MPDTPPGNARLTAPLLGLAVLTAVDIAIAGRWGLLADEAYYWVWSQTPALGYLDHPPAIAWLTAAVSWDTPLGVRLGAILCGVLAWVALYDLTPRPGLLVALLGGVPVLAATTFFATPDAPLLLGWALAIRGVTKGGPHWLLAGVGLGIALLAKLSGLLLLPVVLAAAPRDLRTHWPWLGLGVAAAMAGPSLGWAANHGGGFVAWQLSHGLTGGGNPLGFLAALCLAPTPLVTLAAGWWMVGSARAVWGRWWAIPPGDPMRTERLAWASVAISVAVFGIASLFGPTEANWLAPAWLGASLGICGWWLPARLGWAGAGLGALVALALVVQVETPWMPLDPAVRVLEGRALARAVHDAEPLDAPLVTERYQEASMLLFETGTLPPRHPACGRPDALPRAGDGPAWLLRPERGDATACDGRVRVTGDPVLLDVSENGRPIGRWQLVPIAPYTAEATP